MKGFFCREVVLESRVENRHKAAAQLEGGRSRRPGRTEKLRLLHDLNERIKELTALHHTARLLQESRKALPALLQELVTILPDAWQYPEIASARVTFDGRAYASPHFAVTPWVQRAEFTTSGGKRGAVEVAYHAERPNAAEGPFLAEERSLLDSLTEMLRSYIDRKETEEALRRQRDLYETLLKAQSDLGQGLLITDAQRIVYANEAASRISGYSAAELLALPSFLELVAPDERPLLRERLRRRLSGQNVIDHYETAITHRQGHRVDLEVAVKLLRGTDAPRLMISARDITARKRTEETLRKLSSAIEQTADVVMITDKAGTIEYVNPAFERLTGYTAEEVIGKTPDILDSGTHGQEVFAELWATIRAGTPFRGVLVNRKKNGELYYAEKTITPVRGTDGTISHFVATEKDVTERRRAEEEKQHLQQRLFQAQKLEALGTLAGGIAHDFNNLLSVIMGFAELASDEVPEGSLARRNLEEVVKAGRRARSLVRQLLAFSRSSASQRCPVSVESLVQETLTFLRASLPPSVEIRLHLERVGKDVWADPTQLQQVVLNLCLNGAHAMGERGGRLKVGVRPVALDAPLGTTTRMLPPGEYVKITVSDNGCGMTPEVQRRMFEPFFTTKPVGEGSGLGLAVVHGIVSSHGGAIAVESLQGRGTTFDIFLPMAEGASQAGETRVSSPPHGAEPPDNPSWGYSDGTDSHHR